MSKDQVLVKKVKVYINGDKFREGKLFYINPRTTRTFTAFLEYLTDMLDPVFGAVRFLRTADGKEEIKSLDALSDGCSYVAYGRQKFQQLEYTEIKPLPPAHSNPNLNLSPRQVPSRKILVSGRAKKITRKSVKINVYANGDPFTPARPILLQPWKNKTWESVIEEIATKVSLRNGAIRKLIDLDGFNEVNFGADLQEDGHYVACGREKFKNVPYGMNILLPPKHQMNRRYPTLPPIDRSHKNAPKSTSSAPALGDKDQFHTETRSQKPNKPQPKQSKAWDEDSLPEEQVPNTITPVRHSGFSSKQLSPVAQSPIQSSRRETPASPAIDNQLQATTPTPRPPSISQHNEKDTEQATVKHNEEYPDNSTATPTPRFEPEKIISVGSRPASQANSERESRSPTPAESPQHETPWPEKQKTTEESKVFGITDSERQNENEIESARSQGEIESARVEQGLQPTESHPNEKQEDLRPESNQNHEEAKDSGAFANLVSETATNGEQTAEETSEQELLEENKEEESVPDQTDTGTDLAKNGPELGNNSAPEESASAEVGDSTPVNGRGEETNENTPEEVIPQKDETSPVNDAAPKDSPVPNHEQPEATEIDADEPAAALAATPGPEEHTDDAGDDINKPDDDEHNELTTDKEQGERNGLGEEDEPISKDEPNTVEGDEDKQVNGSDVNNNGNQTPDSTTKPKSSSEGATADGPTENGIIAEL